MSKNSRNRKRAEAPVAETKIERLEKILGTDQDLPDTTEGAAPVANDETPTAEDEAEQAAIEEHAEEEAEIEATPVVSEPAPVFIPQGVHTPFSFIWAFLAGNPTLSRKAQIAALIACEYNANTVKTQVSRFYKVGGDKAAWLASEKAKRAEEKAKIDQMVAEIRAKKAAEEALEAHEDQANAA